MSHETTDSDCVRACMQGDVPSSPLPPIRTARFGSLRCSPPSVITHSFSGKLLLSHSPKFLNDSCSVPPSCLLIGNVGVTFHVLHDSLLIKLYHTPILTPFLPQSQIIISLSCMSSIHHSTVIICFHKSTVHMMLF